ncbi:putative pectinesterase/pectinesterase inhibitor 24 [Punica granatum]|uniref:Pectinesterase n=2 Tax=Punica granatum TaxID=22663 RepID=A0A218WII0_PUNGR|nr:putative pectinesterase/pectinesterase inhibitor 24 [Punica granatum]OWM72627.1 hypothetical protein CDL15_Pgr013095 [Punica granatum]PKI60124.1 hypothetical protein CRG98_019468 [Punica granatum]
MASLYGKISEAEQARLKARRKSWRRIITIALSSVVLAVVIVAAVVGTQSHRAGSKKDGVGSDPSSLSTSVKAVCDVTLYKESCYNSMSQKVKPNQFVQPHDLFKLSVMVAMDELSKASEHISGQMKAMNDSAAAAAVDSCGELLDLAMDHLNGSYMSGLDASDDLRTWLSTARTCLETCIDGFDELALGPLKGTVKGYLKTPQELTSNSLAIITWISNIMGSIKLRRLMGFDYPHKSSQVAPKPLHHKDQSFPEWLKPKDRKLIQSSADLRKIANVVVAKDGSGKYKTIKAALKAVPDKSDKRYVIYVKKGVYVENVRVEKPKWNVVMVGDGKDATIVSGRLNVVDGTPTFQSATFAVFGKGFIARDMGFRNTAGPSKHQAVALMSTADQSVFYRCKFDAFQDTLYAHSNRQFYRECDILGTVDFIFGNSAVVLQTCNIRPRVPMKGQQDTITAQGRVDPNQNTGISIQNCTLWPWGDLRNVRTYLGRPWKNYSRTVYMTSLMGGFIDPKGWLPWTGDSAPSTIYYAEYKNYGSGSNTKNRVKWKGLRTNLSTKEAEKFTVKSFIMGDSWIKKADVSFKSGL